MYGDRVTNFITEVKGSEMIASFQARAEFHNKRADVHFLKLKEVQKITPMSHEDEANEKLDDADLPSRYDLSNSAKANMLSAQDNIRAKIQRHLTQRDKFRFLATHTNPDVTQKLTLNDLSDLHLLEPIS